MPSVPRLPAPPQPAAAIECSLALRAPGRLVVPSCRRPCAAAFCATTAVTSLSARADALAKISAACFSTSASFSYCFLLRQALRTRIQYSLRYDLIIPYIFPLDVPPNKDDVDAEVAFDVVSGQNLPLREVVQAITDSFDVHEQNNIPSKDGRSNDRALRLFPLQLNLLIMLLTIFLLENDRHLTDRRAPGDLVEQLAPLTRKNRGFDSRHMYILFFFEESGSR